MLITYYYFKKVWKKTRAREIWIIISNLTMDLEKQNFKSSWIVQFSLIKDDTLYEVVPVNNVFALWFFKTISPVQWRDELNHFHRLSLFFFHLINKSTSCVLKKDNKLKVINSNLKAAFRYLSMNRYYGKDITSPSLFYNIKWNSVYNVPHNLKKKVYMCHETIIA